MEELEQFVDNIKELINKKLEQKFAQMNTLDTINSSILNGYRGMGVNQFMKYQTTSSSTDPSNASGAYTVGSSGPPVVSE